MCSAAQEIGIPLRTRRRFTRPSADVLTFAIEQPANALASEVTVRRPLQPAEEDTARHVATPG